MLPSYSVVDPFLHLCPTTYFGQGITKLFWKLVDDFIDFVIFFLLSIHDELNPHLSCLRVFLFLEISLAMVDVLFKSIRVKFSLFSVYIATFYLYKVYKF